MICEVTKKIGNNEIDTPIGRSSNWRLTKRPRCTSNFQEAMGLMHLQLSRGNGI